MEGKRKVEGGAREFLVLRAVCVLHVLGQGIGGGVILYRALGEALTDKVSFQQTWDVTLK